MRPMIKEDMLNELNAWAAGRQKEQPAAVSDPGGPLEPATVADIDATLVKCSTEELRRIVAAAGPVPMMELRYMTADQRRALRAQNLLARRQASAQKEHNTLAAQLERQAVVARQQREEQARADLAPIVEKKRRELAGGW